MGSIGDTFDNALMENFWSTLKIELVYRNSWRTRDEAENAIFAYIDGWYNTRRIQKDLGWRAPTSTKPPGTPHQRTAGPDGTFSLSPPAPGNEPSGKPGEPHHGHPHRHLARSGRARSWSLLPCRCRVRSPSRLSCWLSPSGADLLVGQS